MNSQIADLYAGSFEGFLTRRSELAAAIRSTGDRAAAKAITSLRKPTRGAWLVNLLVHHATAEVTEVLDLGEALARAHRDADPDELRRLSGLRNAVIDSLVRRAVGLGAEQGYQAADAVRQEVAETLQAAMADQELADRVLAGGLVATVRAAGFGPTDLFAPALAEVIPIRPEVASPAAAAPAPDPAEVRRLERERGRAEGRLEEAQERLERTRTAAEQARAAWTEAKAEESEVADIVARLTAELAEANRAHVSATRRTQEWESRSAEQTTATETALAETQRLQQIIAEITERLAALGVTD